MPYQHRFTQEFTDKINRLNAERKKAVLAELKKFLQLTNPKDAGGAYLIDMWAYPYP